MLGQRWRRGDLGRFIMEDRSCPRFEVVEANPNVVTVWYGGRKSSEGIPFNTFKTQCVNWWNVQVVSEGSTPKWLREGATFTLPEAQLVQGVVKPSLNLNGRPWTAEVRNTVDVSREELIVRSIRWDYASCMSKLSGQLLLIPIPTIASKAIRPLTAWTRLMEDEDPDPIEDLFA